MPTVRPIPSWTTSCISCSRRQHGTPQTLKSRCGPSGWGTTSVLSSLIVCARVCAADCAGRAVQRVA